jgi:prolipoprotein diacylglyceryltransferase
MYPPVDPVIVQLGPLTLRWYGVLIIHFLSAFVRRTSTTAPLIQRTEEVDDPIVQRRLRELGYLE